MSLASLAAFSSPSDAAAPFAGSAGGAGAGAGAPAALGVALLAFARSARDGAAAFLTGSAFTTASGASAFGASVFALATSLAALAAAFSCVALAWRIALSSAAFSALDAGLGGAACAGGAAFSAGSALASTPQNSSVFLAWAAFARSARDGAAAFLTGSSFTTAFGASVFDCATFESTARAGASFLVGSAAAFAAFSFSARSAR